MRGQLRLTSGRRLSSPKCQLTRPTTARVREAVMNILGSRLHGCSWLDLCSGSGVMACEALERGAARITAVENDGRTARICRQNLYTVRESCSPEASVEVVKGDCLSWLSRERNQEAFDLVYLDPPYESELYQSILSALASGLWTTQASLVICEHASKLTLEADDSWITVDRRCYGTTSVHFLSPREHCHHVCTDSRPPQTSP